MVVLCGEINGGSLIDEVDIISPDEKRTRNCSTPHIHQVQYSRSAIIDGNLIYCHNLVG